MKLFPFKTVGLSLFLVGALFCFGCKQKAEPKPPVVRPVKTLVLDKAGVPRTMSYPGRVQAADSVEIAFEVAGRITEFPIRRGQTVEKGGVIARLDPRDFENKVASNRARFLQTKADLERYRNLYADNAISISELQIKQREHEVAKANLDIAFKALDDSILRAPFTGVIARQYVENFQNVNAKEPIVSFQDLSLIDILIDVPERDMAKAEKLKQLFDVPQHKMAQEAKKLNLQSTAVFETVSNKAFPITLKEFETEADPITQTFRIKFVMPAPQGINIMPGMTSTVTLTGTEQGFFKDVEFVIPSAAVFPDEEGNQCVWVVHPTELSVHKRKVTVGNITGTDSIEITKGLTAGERIAVAAVHQLQEGMKIRLIGDKIGR